MPDSKMARIQARYSGNNLQNFGNNRDIGSQNMGSQNIGSQNMGMPHNVSNLSTYYSDTESIGGISSRYKAVFQKSRRNGLETTLIDLICSDLTHYYA